MQAPPPPMELSLPPGHFPRGGVQAPPPPPSLLELRASNKLLVNFFFVNLSFSMGHMVLKSQSKRGLLQKYLNISSPRYYKITARNAS